MSNHDDNVTDLHVASVIEPPDEHAAPGEHRVEESAGYIAYWKRQAQQSGQRAHEDEERALLAEERAEAAEERAEAAEERAEAARRRADGLEAALRTRATVEQATGVIMGAFGLSADPAFEVLVWVAQRADATVTAVAPRFLAGVHDLDLGSRHREQLTGLLASLASVPRTRVPTAQPA